MACTGNCNQGRTCSCVPKGEMSCYHDDAEERRKGESMGMAFIALCAIAIVALCVVGGYLLYEPVVFLLRQFN